MSATAGKQSKGSKPAAVTTLPRGNIYDRIAEARAKRDAVSGAAKPAPKSPVPPISERLETRAPTVPFPPDTALKPLKEKKTPANLATFPALIDADPPAPEVHPSEDSAPRLAQPFLWGASALVAAVLIGLFITRAGPQDVAQSGPVAVDARASRPAVATRPAANPRPAQSDAIPSLSTQSPDIFGIVAPGETTGPGSGPRVTPRPTIAATAPILTAPPRMDAAPVTREDGSIGTPARFDPGAYRIVVQAPPSIAETDLNAIVQSLDTAGLVAEPRSVNLSISRSNVRFYHPEDAALATYIAENIQAEARDFTTFRPRPATGLIEIWLEGRRSAATASSNAPGTSFAASLRRLQIGLQRAFGQR